MAAKTKPEAQKQDPSFLDDSNRDVIKPAMESHKLSKAPTGEQNTPSKNLRSSFATKSPVPMLTTHNDLQRNVQQLVDDINAKRKRDADSLAEVRKALEVQMNDTGNILEETLVGIYEENSKVIQDKLQEIFSTLDRISNLERELSEFKQALESLYQDLHDPS